MLEQQKNIHVFYQYIKKKGKKLKELPHFFEAVLFIFILLTPMDLLALFSG
ncbi:hypothetical protein A0O32_1953 [Anoxybacillus flavithermus]|nr:hypothetical protein A0O32_1953 [Anoxybacillus flavithermus]